MVGPEKDGSLLETKLRAKELNVAVFITGKLSKQDWIDESKNHSIFINTTHFDAFSTQHVRDARVTIDFETEPR